MKRRHPKEPNHRTMWTPRNNFQEIRHHMVTENYPHRKVFRGLCNENKRNKTRNKSDSGSRMTFRFLKRLIKAEAEAAKSFGEITVCNRFRAVQLVLVIAIGASTENPKLEAATASFGFDVNHK